MGRLACVAMILMPGAALAQGAAQAADPVTSIALAIVSGTFSVLMVVVPIWVNAHIKDRNAAETVDKAVGNALGAAENAAMSGLGAHPLQASLPGGTSPSLAAGVQYVLDHAGPEMARVGISPAAIADKISARFGLVRLQAQTSPPKPGATT